MANRSPAPPAEPRSAAAHNPPPRDNGYRYRPQFGVVVVCDDEAHHKRLFEALTAFGLKCRAVSV